MTRSLFSLLLLVAVLFGTSGCGSFRARPAEQGSVWQQPQTGTRIGRRVEGRQTRERAASERRAAKPKRERAKPQRERKQRPTAADDDFVPRGGFR